MCGVAAAWAHCYGTRPQTRERWPTELFQVEMASRDAGTGEVECAAADSEVLASRASKFRVYDEDERATRQ